MGYYYTIKVHVEWRIVSVNSNCRDIETRIMMLNVDNRRRFLVNILVY